MPHMIIENITEPSVVVLTDPCDILDALCEAGEWDLARRLARAADRDDKCVVVR